MKHFADRSADAEIIEIADSYLDRRYDNMARMAAGKRPRAIGLLEVAENTLSRTPALSIAGIAAKAEVLAAGDYVNKRLVKSICRDML